MKLDMYRDIEKESTIYRFEIQDRDFLLPRFTPSDEMLLEDCQDSNFIHDTLLVLEMVSRRIWESQKS